MELDLRIDGGTVVDGTGAPGRGADVGIKDGKIVTIADAGRLEGSAARTIDATGLVVAPGFVDVHTHLDAQVFWDPYLTPSSVYGVTSVVAGNCGFTIAPLQDADAGYMSALLSRVEGIPLEPLRQNVPWDWTTTSEYFESVERAAPALNMGFFAGHSAIRRAVMGDESTGRAATAAEIEQMGAVLDRALTEGALGFSSSGTKTHVDGNGDPAPSRLAGDDELLALAEVTGRHEGTQLAMIPCAFTDIDDRYRDLMTEMSRRAARPMNWNLLVVDDFTDERLAMSDYAAAHGGMVLAMSYPGLLAIHYTFLSNVFDAIPNWPAVMTLPAEEKMAALRDPAVRERLKAGLASPEGQLRPISKLAGHTIEAGRSPETTALEGRLLGDVAAERGVDPLDLLADLMLLDDLKLGMRRPPIGEDPKYSAKRAELWTDPRVIMGGSDAGAHLDFLTAYNYTATFLELTREAGVPIEQAVYRLTDMPARVYGLRGRGRVAEGWCADLCLFDADDVGTGPMTWRYDLPGGSGRLYNEPRGIVHSVVNGVELLRDGALAETRAGRVLRSGQDTETVRP